MKVSEIFLGLQGEGLYSGAPTVFVRFGGCQLRCIGCDTEYAQDGRTMTDVGAPFIADKILDITSHPRYICLTGGEPLEQSQAELFSLLQIFQTWHGVRGLHAIVLETNGAQNVEWLRQLPVRQLLQFSLDYKTPVTGRHDQMIQSNYMNLRSTDLIKFICRDKDDFAFTKATLERLAESSACQATIWIHMVGGHPNRMLADEILSWTDLHRRFSIRAGVQLHKLLQIR